MANGQWGWLIWIAPGQRPGRGRRSEFPNVGHPRPRAVLFSQSTQPFVILLKISPRGEEVEFDELVNPP